MAWLGILRRRGEREKEKAMATSHRALTASHDARRAARHDLSINQLVLTKRLLTRLTTRITRVRTQRYASVCQKDNFTCIHLSMRMRGLYAATRYVHLYNFHYYIHNTYYLCKIRRMCYIIPDKIPVGGRITCARAFIKATVEALYRIIARDCSSLKIAAHRVRACGFSGLGGRGRGGQAAQNKILSVFFFYFYFDKCQSKQNINTRISKKVHQPYRNCYDMCELHKRAMMQQTCALHRYIFMLRLTSSHTCAPRIIFFHLEVKSNYF
uniref:Uncharacterized protein n=1 Tax=Trichogramma kaykai TaxID=54128 RepID=A0ABD2WNU6_9HYME